MTQPNISRSSSAHLTFDEMAARGLVASPCICWTAGAHGGMQRTQTIHPAEFDDGQASAYESAYDI